MLEGLNWINLFIATLGLTASIYIFVAGKENPYLSKLLAVIIFALSIRNFSQGLINIGIFDFSIFPAYLFVGFQFVVPASVFLYQRALITDELKWKNVYIWHFLPGILAFLIALISFLIYKQNPSKATTPFIYDQSVQELKMIVQAKILYLLWIILAFPYLLFIYRLFIKAASQGSFLGNHGKEIGVWVLIQMIPFTLFFVLLGKEITSAFWNDRPIITNTNHLIIKNLYLLVMVIYIWMKPQLLLGLPKWKTLKNSSSTEFPINLETTGWKNPAADSHPANNQPNLTLLMQSIQDFASNQTAFIQEDFTLEKLSQNTKIPIHHLKFLFNFYQEHGFYGYKNFMRMIKVIEFLSSNKHHSQTIESIGFDAGFGSNSTMLRTFKKHLGASPNEVIQLLQTAEVTNQTNNNRLNSICKLIPTA